MLYSHKSDSINADVDLVVRCAVLLCRSCEELPAFPTPCSVWDRHLWIVYIRHCGHRSGGGGWLHQWPCDTLRLCVLMTGLKAALYSICIYTTRQVAERGGRCSIPGDVQGQVGQGTEQPPLGEAVPAHSTEGWTR